MIEEPARLPDVQLIFEEHLVGDLLFETLGQAGALPLLQFTNELAGVTTIEVSHEALIRVWVRLKDWLSEAREDIQLQQAISNAASEWRRWNESVDRLYRGDQLAVALAWSQRNWPSSEEADFLQAGVKIREWEQRTETQVEESLQQRVQKQQRRYTRRTVLVGAAGVGLAVVASVTTGLLVQHNLQPFYKYEGHSGDVNSVAWSPDGSKIASGSSDSTVQVWVWDLP